MIYSVALVLGVQQSKPVTLIRTSILFSVFFRFFSHIGCCRVLNRVHVLYSRFSLPIFIYNNVYMSIPVCQFIPASYVCLHSLSADSGLTVRAFHLMVGSLYTLTSISPRPPPFQPLETIVLLSVSMSSAF